MEQSLPSRSPIDTSFSASLLSWTLTNEKSIKGTPYFRRVALICKRTRLHLYDSALGELLSYPTTVAPPSSHGSQFVGGEGEILAMRCVDD